LDIREGREPVEGNVKTRLKAILRTIVYADKKRVFDSDVYH